jgi:parallel beta-helix repeat protein
MRRVISVLGVAVLALALAPAAAATAGTLFVTSDTILTEDHHGSIVIGADDVTLDCAGFGVIGPDQPDGIVIDGYDRVTVKNCHITGFEEHGINIPAAAYPELTGNVSEINERSGYYLGFVSHSVLQGNTARDNGGHGIEFEGGPSFGHLVEDNVSTDNFNGFYITAVSGSTFAGNVASYNEMTGFELDQDVGPGNTFEGNEASGNGERGFNVNQSNDNLLAGNTLSGNGGAGILLGGARNTVRGNDVSGNGFTGIELPGSDDNVIILNSLAGNGWGLLLYSGSERNLIRDNDVGWNDSTGISIEDGSDWNFVEGNTAANNDSTGFHISASHNTLLGNTAMHNGEYGFRISEGRANKIALSSACNNGTFDAFQDPGVRGNAWIKNSFCTSNI